jgi:hypothetical protein
MKGLLEQREYEGREAVEQQARLWYLACYMLYGAWKRKRKTLFF